ncbi:hypothetical protein WDU94_012599, partial [Cyamophila willieti]
EISPFPRLVGTSKFLCRRKVCLIYYGFRHIFNILIITTFKLTVPNGVKLFVLFQIFSFMLIGRFRSSCHVVHGTAISKVLFLMIVLIGFREVQAGLTCYSSEHQRAVECGDDDAKCITVCSRHVTIQGCSTGSSCLDLKSLYPHITDCQECKRDICNTRACVRGRVSPHSRFRHGGRVKGIVQPDRELITLPIRDKQYGEGEDITNQDTKDKDYVKGKDITQSDAIGDDENAQYVHVKEANQHDPNRGQTGDQEVKIQEVMKNETSRDKQQDEHINVKDITQREESKDAQSAKDGPQIESNEDARSVIEEIPRRQGNTEKTDGKVTQIVQKEARKNIKVVKVKNVTRYKLLWPDSVDYDAVSVEHIKNKNNKPPENIGDNWGDDNQILESSPPIQQTATVTWSDMHRQRRRTTSHLSKTTEQTLHRDYTIINYVSTEETEIIVIHTTNEDKEQKENKSTTDKPKEEDDEEEECDKSGNDKPDSLNTLEKILLGLLLTLLTLICLCFCCHAYVCRPWCCKCNMGDDSCDVIHNEKLEIIIKTNSKSRCQSQPREKTRSCMRHEAYKCLYDESSECVTTQTNSVGNDMEMNDSEWCNKVKQCKVKQWKRCKDPGTRTVCNDYEGDNLECQSDRFKTEHIKGDNKDIIDTLDCSSSKSDTLNNDTKSEYDKRDRKRHHVQFDPDRKQHCQLDRDRNNTVN